jgi:c-di-AMP phosphodiesterase-like protein
MARRTKGEEALLGLVGLVGIIVAILYAIVKAIVTFVIAHWIIFIGIILGIILIFIILLYIGDAINLRQNNKKIDVLNNIAESVRSDILIDYENIISNKELLTIFDNAVIHFPKKTFLDPEYLNYFESRYLRNH